MNPKINAEHLSRGAVVYVRQSTPGQVVEHTESQRRQYALADSARSIGFTTVTIIDDDLGRSGSGLTQRPGFQKLVALVCAASTGAVFCIERGITSCSQWARLASPDRPVCADQYSRGGSGWYL